MPIVTERAPLPQSAPVAGIPAVDRIAAAKAVAAGRQPDITENSAPATTPEATAAETTAEGSPDEQLSPKFAALARKERALRSKYQEFKAREEALKAKEAEISSFSTLKSRATQEPLAVLQELGISYDMLTNAILNQPDPESQAYAKLQAEIDAVKQAQTQSQKQLEEAQVKQYEQAVNQIRTDVKQLVASDPTFETIKDMSQEEAVVELIKETFNSQGILLELSEAAQQVEDYLVEEALKYAQLKKVQQKLSPPAPQSAQSQKTSTSQKLPMKTLTNAVTASTPGKLSERERRERAILAFRGQLK